MDYRLLISVVFTEPQVAFVGLTEKEATARSIPFLAASYPFNDHGKSLIMEAKDGFVKLLADPKSGEILGGACVGPVGGELTPRNRRGDGEAHDRSRTGRRCRIIIRRSRKSGPIRRRNWSAKSSEAPPPA